MRQLPLLTQLKQWYLENGDPTLASQINTSLEFPMKMQTRAYLMKQSFVAPISQLEPKRVDEALQNKSEAMKEEFDQFERN